MPNTHLKALLHNLGLSSKDSVIFKEQSIDSEDPLPGELTKRLGIIRPDAYYVFNKQPLILFFDLSNNIDLEYESRIHKQAWSFDYAPLIFIVKSSEIEIFNAFDYDKKAEKLQQIHLTDTERNDVFSFWNLQTGESWKWLNANYYKTTINKRRVNQRLFDNIKEVRVKLIDQELNGSSCLTEDEANVLILRLIFIRYLIDRDVKINSEYIKGESILEKRNGFIDLIKNPNRLKEFFSFLNDKFNGVLFEDADVRLSTFQSKSLASVFDGRKDKATPSLFDNWFEFYFDIFDFSIIPVEVISGIYESLINDDTKTQQSAVYTPSFLVEYILSETIDPFFASKRTSECKIFDPSCGSGIFLVQAFRRMVDREILMHPGKLSKTRLREIAKNNLFGVDVNAQALKVTCFSIYIAILDFQDPKSIIDSFKFPRLIDENLFCSDFFDLSHHFNNVIKGKTLDFILGNPPWKSNKGQKHIDWLKDSNNVTGRFEIAQSFLIRAKDFMSRQTLSALIVTSTIFYNISKTTQSFKRRFLSEFCITKFFDLSPVRRLIFEEKNSPAAIVYYQISYDNAYVENIVSHISVKSNLYLKYYKSLIIEKFDQKEIKQKLFIENEWMFKVALYGNTLDFVLINKLLNGTPTRLHDRIDNKSIFKGDGILKGTPKEKPFNFLVGLPLLENSEVRPYYTAVSKDTKSLSINDTFLESGRRAELFIGEHIYLKAQTLEESQIVVSYCPTSAVNKHDVIAITSVDRPNDLKALYAQMISNLFTYYQFLTSSAWGVATRPAIRLEEYLSFPSKDLSKDARILNLVVAFLEPFEKYYTSFFKSQSAPVDQSILKLINEEVNRLYDISAHEIDLIDYVLNVSRYQFQERHLKFTNRANVSKIDLKNYVEVFVNEFNNLYQGETINAEVYLLRDFIAINFKFIADENIEDSGIHFKSDESDVGKVLKDIANNLSISKITDTKDPSKNLFIQKDLKGFEKDSFYIIKPNEFKCWHRAIAWYDVAEIKSVIQKAELDYMTDHIHV